MKKKFHNDLIRYVNRYYCVNSNQAREDSWVIQDRWRRDICVRINMNMVEAHECTSQLNATEICKVLLGEMIKQTDVLQIVGGQAQSDSVGSWGEPGVVWRSMIKEFARSYDIHLDDSE